MSENNSKKRVVKWALIGGSGCLIPVGIIIVVLILPMLLLFSIFGNDNSGSEYDQTVDSPDASNYQLEGWAKSDYIPAIDDYKASWTESMDDEIDDLKEKIQKEFDDNEKKRKAKWEKDWEEDHPTPTPAPSSSASPSPSASATPAPTCPPYPKWTLTFNVTEESNLADWYYIAALDNALQREKIEAPNTENVIAILNDHTTYVVEAGALVHDAKDNTKVTVDITAQTNTEPFYNVLDYISKTDPTYTTEIIGLGENSYSYYQTYFDINGNYQKAGNGQYVAEFDTKEYVDFAITLTEGYYDSSGNYVYTGKHLPYVWGGTSLTNGADCSGVHEGIWRHFGLTGIGGAARSQGLQGIYISRNALEPGDYLFYKIGTDRPWWATHVAMYIGNGEIVHEIGGGMQISKASSYDKYLVVCKRLIKDKNKADPYDDFNDYAPAPSPSQSS